jgi:hypothetical protein
MKSNNSKKSQMETRTDDPRDLTRRQRLALSTLQSRSGWKAAIEMGLLSLSSTSWQSIPGYLAVKRSDIPGAGRGVFADRVFRAGTLILFCAGSFVHEAGQTDAKRRYSFILPDHPGVVYQCFHDRETNMIKYVNSAYGTENASANAKVAWCSGGTVLILVAKDSICRGHEILLDYRH